MNRMKQEHYMPLIAPEGVTPSEATALIAIRMSEKAGVAPVQPHIIAKGLQHSPSAVSQTLKALEEKGYLVRERMSEDSRAVSLNLTARGSKIAEDVDRMRDEFFGELLEYIGKDDANHLLNTLEKILDFHLEQAKVGKMKRISMPEHVLEGLSDVPNYQGESAAQDSLQGNFAKVGCKTSSTKGNPCA
ncbi:MAG: MarR family winged helix-turn-helix transcriptional regulator [Coriobacteriaceae bacterium]|nr:MarR family winged helix-turn-helix transcriptional regulator [Coriobacteriaceae bacterium]